LTILKFALAAAMLMVAAGCAAPYPPAHGPRYTTPGFYPRMADDARPWRMTRRGGETDYELSDHVLFALDSARISDRAASILDEIAQAARARPGCLVVVEGHTDTSGTWEHNQELSQARARAVAMVLARQGVAPDRIRAEGLGKSGLAVQTGDGVREPRNRRVVIRLMDAPSDARRPFTTRYDGLRRDY
jgi:outer membrane protein OmpA-like peptidoglycan-associated protein